MASTKTSVQIHFFISCSYPYRKYSSVGTTIASTSMMMMTEETTLLVFLLLKLNIFLCLPTFPCLSYLFRCLLYMKASCFASKDKPKINIKVTVHPSGKLLLHPPIKAAFGEGRMPAATTFSHGLRSECANLPELLRVKTSLSPEFFRIVPEFCLWCGWLRFSSFFQYQRPVPVYEPQSVYITVPSARYWRGLPFSPGK